MLGGDVKQVAAAVSQAWIDGGALRTYRHAPNTGSRKSWAAGDATRRAVQLALWTMRGEMGYASAMTAPKWGFHDVVLGGRPVVLSRPLGNYVMENILFKVSYPAEFHAQTAAEAGIQLHPQVVHRLDEIDHIVIETQESAMRIINKTGPLHNYADRDHCIQYITAAGLLFGTLNAEHYEDAAAADPRIDTLRAKMKCVEHPRYTKEYLDPDKRSIANSVQVFFRDGTSTDRIEIEYPLGHRRRRNEAVPKILEKFQQNVGTKYVSTYAEHLSSLFKDRAQLESMSASGFMSLWTA
jgi:2-methylcitrate dehydratase